jgi:hypothetical protein
MRKLLFFFIFASSAAASDEFTFYDLLPPESHQFAITYDVAQTREGATVYLNPIRPGSVATKEKVLAHTTGAELPFDVVSGKDAKAAGQLPATTADDAQFIRVQLPAAVPKGGQTRIRIIKTYTDAVSYGIKDGQLVFLRPLGIKRNVVLLPKGWEIIGCESPAMISTDSDGRVRVSFLNDRDDQLPVRIVGRRLP